MNCRPSALARLAVLLVLPLGARAAGPFSLHELAPGEFVHLGQPLPLDAPGHDDIANIGFVVGRRCVAVIDSGGSVRIGRALRAAIAARTTLPVCYVINTHVHVDHLLGNAAFVADHPQFIGHAQLNESLARSRDFFLKSYAADLDAPASAAQLIGAERTVPLNGELKIDLGERSLVLHAWPSAHTDCDLTVYEPASGTLWTGDLLFVHRIPVVDGSVRGWLKVIQSLALQPARRFVPGHGEPGTDLAAALASERGYLQLLVDQVDTALAHGRPLQQALKDFPADNRDGWLLWDETNPHNVARVYQELEWQ